MRRTHRLGRILRAHPLTARLLTEYHARTLPRQEESADLRACLEFARPGTLALDIGASVGNFALAMARVVGREGQVLALEANPDVYRELRASVWGTAVAPLNLAASSENAWLSLRVPVAATGEQTQLGTLESRDGPVTTHLVRAVRIDDIVEGTRAVSIIKIDVEGHEAEVLAGAEETLAREQPALVVEIEARHVGEHTARTTVEWLLGRDYTCVALAGRGSIPWREFSFEAHQLELLEDGGTSIAPGQSANYANNFLFLPKGRS